MSAPQPMPYLLLPGTAREALERYRDVFGGELHVHTYGDFGRGDGPADAVAHGILTGPVSLFAADAGNDEDAFTGVGILLSLLGAAEPDRLREWFASLGDGGRVIAPLAATPWGAWDGQVRDPWGVTWLIGWEPAPAS